MVAPEVLRIPIVVLRAPLVRAARCKLCPFKVVLHVVCILVSRPARLSSVDYILVRKLRTSLFVSSSVVTI